MTLFNTGDIVLVPFPFSDLETTKKRPTLILSVITSKTLPKLYIVCMMTSQVDSENILGDYLMKDWEEVGLLYPTRIRVSKMVTVEEKLLQKKLGQLSRDDSKNIKKIMPKIFSAWIK